ncbi:MAG: N-acetyltransferase [Methanotrichaceae archaeon]|nr:N-acetyltransferase [Methanotrichaceae archaeon]
MIIIREERKKDREAIRAVNEKAFGQPAEASIVDKLRKSCPALLSLVALDGDEVVGHILFSPAKIEGDSKAIEGMGLAPMAVQPAWQRQGIGTRLIKRGIEMLRSRGCPFIIVLGHAEYYPRFGFVSASGHGIASQWDGVPNEAFMILILDQSAMKGVSGVARYRDEFDEAMQE